MQPARPCSARVHARAHSHVRTRTPARADSSGFDDIRTAISRTNRTVAYLRTSSGVEGGPVRLARDSDTALAHAQDAPVLLAAHTRPASESAVRTTGDTHGGYAAKSALRFPAGSAAGVAVARAFEYARTAAQTRLERESAQKAAATFDALERTAVLLRESADALSVAIADRSTNHVSRVLRAHGTEGHVAYYDFEGRAHPPDLRNSAVGARAPGQEQLIPAFTLTRLATSSRRLGAIPLEQEARQSSSVALPHIAVPAPPSGPSPATATAVPASLAPSSTGVASFGAAVSTRVSHSAGVDEASALIAPSDDSFGVGRFLHGNGDNVRTRVQRVPEPRPVVDPLHDIDPYFSGGIRGTLIPLAVEEGRLPLAAANATVLSAEIAAVRKRLRQPRATLRSALSPAFEHLREHTGLKDDWLFARQHEALAAAATRLAGTTAAGTPRATAHARSAAARSRSPTTRPPGHSATFLTALPSEEIAPPRAGTPRAGTPRAAARRARPTSAPAAAQRRRPQRDEQNMKRAVRDTGRRKSLVVLDLEADGEAGAEVVPVANAPTVVDANADKWLFADARAYHPTVVPEILPAGAIRIGDLLLDGNQARTLTRLYSVNPTFATTFAALVYNTRSKQARLRATRTAFSVSASTHRAKLTASLHHRLYAMTLGRGSKAAAVDDVMTLRVRSLVGAQIDEVRSSGSGDVPTAPWSPKRSPPRRGTPSQSPASPRSATFDFSEDARTRLGVASARTEVTQDADKHARPRSAAARLASSLTVTTGTLDESIRAVRVSARKNQLRLQLHSHAIIAEVLAEVPRGKVAGLSGVDRVLLRLLDATLRSGLLMDTTTLFALLQQVHVDVLALHDRDLDVDMDRQVHAEQQRRASVHIPHFPSALFHVVRAAATSHTTQTIGLRPAGGVYALPAGLGQATVRQASSSSYSVLDDYDDDAATARRHDENGVTSAARAPIHVQNSDASAPTAPSRPASASMRWRPSSRARPDAGPVMHAVRALPSLGVVGAPLPHMPQRPPDTAVHASARGTPARAHRNLRPATAVAASPQLVLRATPLRLGAPLATIARPSSAPAIRATVAAPRSGSPHTAAHPTSAPPASEEHSPPHTFQASPRAHAQPPETLMTIEERAVVTARREWAIHLHHPIQALFRGVRADWSVFDAWLRERDLVIPTPENVAALHERHLRRIVTAADASNATHIASSAAAHRNTAQRVAVDLTTPGATLWGKVRALLKPDAQPER